MKFFSGLKVIVSIRVKPWEDIYLAGVLSSTQGYLVALMVITKIECSYFIILALLVMIMIELINMCFLMLFQGFGVAARSTQDCRHADPMTIVAFHQADIGEYIRSEDSLV